MARMVLCFCLAASAMMCCACAGFMGKLPPPSKTEGWQFWEKKGVTSPQAQQVYLACRGDLSSYDQARIAKTQQCMLDAGFNFLDDPMRPLCDQSEKTKDRPACQSLLKKPPT